MIAIDTNILVRHLVNDDLAQARAARELIESLTPEQPASYAVKSLSRSCGC